MRKLFLTLWMAVLVVGSGYSKKVKFAVDMINQTVSPNGVFVNGDFQTLLGLPNNDTIAVRLQREGTSSIYSTVLTLPAFRKYEYKFINGNQFYEAEFIPEPSRVGHDFNDNRWIYVDSTVADTFFLGAIKFAENAPAGLNMIRFKVEMDFTPVSQPVHVAGNFSTWNFARNTMYNFIDHLFEIILFAPAGNYEFAYAHGSTAGNAEEITGNCANANGRRTLLLSSDSILDPVCFGKCTPCVTGLNGSVIAERIISFPHPVNGPLFWVKTGGDLYDMKLFSSQGQLLKTIQSSEALEDTQIELPGQGFFLLELQERLSKNRQTIKIVRQ